MGFIILKRSIRFILSSFFCVSEFQINSSRAVIMKTVYRSGFILASPCINSSRSVVLAEPLCIVEKFSLLLNFSF